VKGFGPKPAAVSTKNQNGVSLDFYYPVFKERGHFRPANSNCNAGLARLSRSNQPSWPTALFGSAFFSSSAATFASRPSRSRKSFSSKRGQMLGRVVHPVKGFFSTPVLPGNRDGLLFIVARPFDLHVFKCPVRCRFRGPIGKRRRILEVVRQPVNSFSYGGQKPSEPQPLP
jgi:hypothetical protein